MSNWSSYFWQISTSVRRTPTTVAQMQIALILMVLLNVYVRRVLPVMAIHVAVRLTNHKNIVNVIPRVYNLLIIPRTRPQFQKLWYIIVFCFANRKISKTMNVINTIFLVSVRITNILVNKNYWSPSILHAVRHSAGMHKKCPFKGCSSLVAVVTKTASL